MVNKYRFYNPRYGRILKKIVSTSLILSNLYSPLLSETFINRNIHNMDEREQMGNAGPQVRIDTRETEGVKDAKKLIESFKLAYFGTDPRGKEITEKVRETARKEFNTLCTKIEKRKGKEEYKLYMKEVTDKKESLFAVDEELKKAGIKSSQLSDLKDALGWDGNASLRETRLKLMEQFLTNTNEIIQNINKNLPEDKKFALLSKDDISLILKFYKEDKYSRAAVVHYGIYITKDLKDDILDAYEKAGKARLKELNKLVQALRSSQEVIKRFEDSWDTKFESIKASIAIAEEVEKTLNKRCNEAQKLLLSLDKSGLSCQYYDAAYGQVLEHMYNIQLLAWTRALEGDEASVERILKLIKEGSEINMKEFGVSTEDRWLQSSLDCFLFVGLHHAVIGYQDEKTKKMMMPPLSKDLIKELNQAKFGTGTDQTSKIFYRIDDVARYEDGILAKELGGKWSPQNFRKELEKIARDKNLDFYFDPGYRDSIKLLADNKGSSADYETTKILSILSYQELSTRRGMYPDQPEAFGALPYVALRNENDHYYDTIKNLSLTNISIFNQGIEYSRSLNELSLPFYKGVYDKAAKTINQEIYNALGAFDDKEIGKLVDTVIDLLDKNGDFPKNKSGEEILPSIPPIALGIMQNLSSGFMEKISREDTELSEKQIKQKTKKSKDLKKDIVTWIQVETALYRYDLYKTFSQRVLATYNAALYGTFVDGVDYPLKYFVTDFGYIIASSENSLTNLYEEAKARNKQVSYENTMSLIDKVKLVPQKEEVRVDITDSDYSENFVFVSAWVSRKEGPNNREKYNGTLFIDLKKHNPTKIIGIEADWKPIDNYEHFSYWRVNEEFTLEPNENGKLITVKIPYIYRNTSEKTCEVRASAIGQNFCASNIATTYPVIPSMGKGYIPNISSVPDRVQTLFLPMGEDVTPGLEFYLPDAKLLYTRVYDQTQQFQNNIELSRQGRLNLISEMNETQLEIIKGLYNNRNDNAMNQFNNGELITPGISILDFNREYYKEGEVENAQAKNIEEAQNRFNKVKNWLKTCSDKNEVIYDREAVRYLAESNYGPQAQFLPIENPFSTRTILSANVREVGVEFDKKGIVTGLRVLNGEMIQDISVIYKTIVMETDPITNISRPKFDENGDLMTIEKTRNYQVKKDIAGMGLDLSIDKVQGKVNYMWDPGEHFYTRYLFQWIPNEQQDAVKTVWDVVSKEWELKVKNVTGLKAIDFILNPASLLVQKAVQISEGALQTTTISVMDDKEAGIKQVSANFALASAEIPISGIMKLPVFSQAWWLLNLPVEGLTFGTVDLRKLEIDLSPTLSRTVNITTTGTVRDVEWTDKLEALLQVNGFRLSLYAIGPKASDLLKRGLPAATAVGAGYQTDIGKFTFDFGAQLSQKDKNDPIKLPFAHPSDLDNTSVVNWHWGVSYHYGKEKISSKVNSAVKKLLRAYNDYNGAVVDKLEDKFGKEFIEKLKDQAVSVYNATESESVKAGVAFRKSYEDAIQNLSPEDKKIYENIKKLAEK